MYIRYNAYFLHIIATGMVPRAYQCRPLYGMKYFVRSAFCTGSEPRATKGKDHGVLVLRVDMGNSVTITCCRG